jgi:hypothetical protein
LTVGQRISLRAREPPPPLISFQDITAELTAPEPKQKEGELEFGQSGLVEAVEQGPTLTTQLKQPTESFTAKFNTSKEDKAEQGALDRFESAKRLTALYRQIEGPALEPPNVGIKAEAKADPDVESLRSPFLQPASLTGERKAKYKGVLGLLFRGRAPPAEGEEELSEFETPRLTVGQRISLRAREPPPPLISFQDITAGLTAPEPKQKEGELEFGPSTLVEAVEQGPTLTTQLKQPVGGASQLLDADKSKALISHQPEPPAPPSPEPQPEPELQFELEDTDAAPIQKVKKPRTPKQIEAFEKARKIRSEKAIQRKAEQDAMMKEAYRIADEEQKKAVKEMQDVIVEKAVKIKKNQIKKIKELDENSVDVGSINKIVNPYHEFRNKFNIR